jgi:hypothetical protein
LLLPDVGAMGRPPAQASRGSQESQEVA